MNHWAISYIGQPWGPPGSGLSCWEWVRAWVAQHYACTLPELPHDAMRLREWMPVAAVRLPADLPAEDGDVLLLRGSELHAGVVIDAGDGLRLLHADGLLRNGQAVGQVVAQRLTEATEGYSRAELWRRYA
jgi:hypothetical protein